jgi:flagellar basal body rod protein FlgG
MYGLSFNSNLPNAAQSAQLGIARGIGGLNQDAQVVAQSVTGSGGDLTAALVDSLQQKLAVEASAKVLAVSDQMLGTLVDVMA